MGHLAIGVSLGGFPDGLPDPQALYRLVEGADDLDIDSIWLSDHPLSESAALDPTVLMSTIAARTEDIKMGPSVLTLPARNPVTVANTAANLDYLTGGRGRVILGVGLGAEPDLCEAMGIPADERAARLREGVEILRLLWTEDEVDYDGEFYHLDGATVEPKPAVGTLDIWIGGNSDAALRRIAEYGDGWFPAMLPPRGFEVKHERLMRFCEEAGREVERDEAGIIVPTHVAPDAEQARQFGEQFRRRSFPEVSAERFDEFTAFGTAESVLQTLQDYVDAGCTKFVLRPVCPFEERVEQYERWSDDVIPNVEAP
jgi:probable F420-dependent oxidoreductase